MLNLSMETHHINPASDDDTVSCLFPQNMMHMVNITPFYDSLMTGEVFRGNKKSGHVSNVLSLGYSHLGRSDESVIKIVSFFKLFHDGIFIMGARFHLHDGLVMQRIKGFTC